MSEEIVDPVEITEPQESDTAEIEEAAPSDSDETTAETPKPKGVQKRIDELTRNWRDTERDRDYWRNLAVQAQQKPEPEKPKEVHEGEPLIDQFEDYEDFLIAKAEYRISKKHEADKVAETAKEKQIQQQKQAQEFQSKLNEARTRYSDFDAVAFDPSVPYSDPMTELVMNSENAIDLAYHLGQNKQDAFRIAQLDPVSAAREIGRLEVQLSIPKPKTVTDAPQPTGSVGHKETVTQDPSKMTTAEWMQWRNQQVNR